MPKAMSDKNFSKMQSEKRRKLALLNKDLRYEYMAQKKPDENSYWAKRVRPKKEDGKEG